MNYPNFDNIRPFDKNEIFSAFHKLTLHPYFHQIAQYVFPQKSSKEVRDYLLGCSDVLDFQKKFMHHAIRVLLEKTSDGLSFEGLENLNKNETYLYISNHRDIFLDSGILQILLVEQGLNTTEITFGSNLMGNVFLDTLGKINKMFTVFRGGSRREKYENTMQLSAYIQYALREKQESVWIAQRGGRTKDGNDLTQEGLIRMLSMYESSDFFLHYSSLNIVPISVSYEYEPCDFLKARELFLSKEEPYLKEKGEDFNSIMTGINQQKGRIHLAISNPVNEKILQINNDIPDKEKISALAKIIDKNIYNSYKLWKTNYIAYDMFFGGGKYKQFYTDEDYTSFYEYMLNGLNTLDIKHKEIKDFFLKIYYNPVLNK